MRGYLIVLSYAPFFFFWSNHMLLFDLYLFKVLCITPYLFCLRKITHMHVGLSQDRQWVIYLVCQA